MCAEGHRRSKGATLRWCDGQGKGLFTWFRWVFVSIDDHEPSCRWARLVRRVL